MDGKVLSICEIINKTCLVLFIVSVDKEDGNNLAADRNTDTINVTSSEIVTITDQI